MVTWKHSCPAWTVRWQQHRQQQWTWSLLSFLSFFWVKSKLIDSNTKQAKTGRCHLTKTVTGVKFALPEALKLTVPCGHCRLTEMEKQESQRCSSVSQPSRSTKLLSSLPSRSCDCCCCCCCFYLMCMGVASECMSAHVAPAAVEARGDSLELKWQMTMRGQMGARDPLPGHLPSPKI